MIREDRRLNRWLVPPRNLLLALVAIAATSAAALGWLGWEMLRQDARDRQDRDADRVVQLLARELADVEERLATAATGTTLAADGPFERGLLVTFTRESVHPVPASGLLFAPIVPPRPEPPADLFEAGEALEYGERQPARAAELYRRLAAAAADPAARAGALMRASRALTTSGQDEAALTVYGEMAALGDVPVIGLPADLVARSAAVPVLERMGRVDDARNEARGLLADLTGGRWRLTRGQYEHYAEVASAAAKVTSAPVDRLAVTHAVSNLWNDWRLRLAPSGRRAMRINDVPLLVVWSASADRLAAWIVEPRQLAEHLAAESGIAMTLSDADGLVVAGPAGPLEGLLVRTSAATRLPWTVHVGADGAGAQATVGTRGRTTITVLVVMFAFLMASAYFVGRVVKREIELAHLQSDFVSAVSHEFRTPLAAMRQLSELLAAGRVPAEAKRQQYYESLAGESGRLQRLVEGLLDFGKLEAGAQPYAIEPIDPDELVDHVVAEFQSRLGRQDGRIDIFRGGPGTAVLADRAAVGLALHNLLDNAVKYSGQGSTVWIATRREAGRIAISVRDEGLGLARGEERQVFQKFVRGAAAAEGRVRGTGIGLAMVRLVAAGHGGEVTVESVPGLGCTFTLWLKEDMAGAERDRGAGGDVRAVS